MERGQEGGTDKGFRPPVVFFFLSDAMTRRNFSSGGMKTWNVLRIKVSGGLRVSCFSSSGIVIPRSKVQSLRVAGEFLR